MIIDRQAFFTVRYAQNIIKLPPSQRVAALSQMPARGAKLIKTAVDMIEAERHKGATK